MGLFSSDKSGNIKKNKFHMVQLQNIIFGSKEKSLMVSPEFLLRMSDNYVGKRLSAINRNLANMNATRAPANYFKYCDAVDSYLNELIIIEPLYDFKEPVPSEFKETILSNRDHSISSMLNRSWKKILNQSVTTDGIPENPVPFEKLLSEIMSFENRLSPVHLTAVEMYRKSLYPKDDIPKELPDDTEEINTDGFSDNTGDDMFINTDDFTDIF